MNKQIEMSEQNDKHIHARYRALCVLLCLLTALVIFVPFIVKGGGAFTLRDDFNTQELTFTNQVNGFLKTQLPGEWCWSLDLGASFVNGFGFYVLGSPFAWLTFPFPRQLFPYLIGWVYVLKYVVAGLTAYEYLCIVNQKSGWPQITGALIYAFSGFSAAALEFYHFHDVVALFPLLLIGIEKIRKKESFLFFAFAVFVNCLLNYYFFIGEVIFIVLYFIFRFWGDLKAFLRGMGLCIAGGVLGVGMAGVLFVPSIQYILGNPRTDQKLTFQDDLFLDLKEPLYMYLMKGLLIPGEAMNSQCAVYEMEWNSTAGWLPMTGVSLSLTYMIKKRDWLGKFLLLLSLIAFSPYLSSGFSMFTRNYQRWWFMFVLVLAAAAVFVLQESGNYPVAAGVVINLALIALWLEEVIKWQYVKDVRTIYHPRRLLFLVGITVMGLLTILVLHKYRKLGGRLMTVCVSFIAALTTIFTIYVYRINSESTQSILDKYSIAEELEVIDPQYRYAMENNKNLLTLTGDVGGVGAFTSTSGNYRFRLNELFDHSSSVFALRKSDYAGLAELCGAKFVLTDALPEEKPVLQEIEVRDTKWYVTEQAACPIGYMVDRYMLKEDLLSLPLEERGIAMLYAPVIEKDVEGLVAGVSQKVSPQDHNWKKEGKRLVKELVQTYSDNSVTDFDRNSKGMSCRINNPKEQMVFFSVPNEQGWEIRIDGERTESIDAGGFMLVRVPQGEHSLQFRYVTPGLRAGAALTFISVLAFSILVYINRRRSASAQGS